MVYVFAPNRSGEHTRKLLQSCQGKLVCEDYSGYKASFERGIKAVRCMIPARRVSELPGKICTGTD
ncbi:transposase [Aestuariicella hydrocarbonica]|uniref:Transposase n=1 Tax=Pseudomaricurvus hydrocarbonicus TaxID=1470433 RepID=A0A9E5MMZ3_9GAMM|nr:transposase [Aestuariicella hydrocarbonica]